LNFIVVTSFIIYEIFIVRLFSAKINDIIIKCKKITEKCKVGFAFYTYYIINKHFENAINVYNVHHYA